MEFSKKDKLLSLIFPVLTVLYGITVIISRMYHPVMQRITGAVIIAAGIITAALILLLKINTTECLKVQTITAVVTFWLHLVKTSNIVTGGVAADFTNVINIIYFLVVDLGSIVLMMFKLPGGISVRKRLVVFFANPVLYVLINRLMNVFSDFLEDLDLI